MRKKLDLHYESPQGYFSLTWSEYRGEGVGHDDETYDFVLHVLRNYRTGEIVGFSNDGGELGKDYERIMKLLAEKPIAERYDVPALDLYDATIGEIITTLYRRFVLGEKTLAERKAPAPEAADSAG